MTEERITETTDESGNTHTTRTIVHDAPRERSGGGMLVLLGLLAVLAIGAFIVFSQVSESEVAANNAINNAADEVGEAAGAVGEAAQNAGEAVENAVDPE